MSYLVKEIFYTLQGEGAHAGRPAVFCRFTGCNLWTGREEHRAIAVCQFCDTDFVGTDGRGGGRFANADDLAAAVAKAWLGAAHPRSRPYVVCTGGEPLPAATPGSDDFAAGLALVSPSCHWTKGYWQLTDDHLRGWNDLQNTPRDIQLLTDHLLSEYRRASPAKRKSRRRAAG